MLIIYKLGPSHRLAVLVLRDYGRVGRVTRDTALSLSVVSCDGRVDTKSVTLTSTAIRVH